MANKRKLFIAHASELAHRLVRSVRPNGLISDFAKSYANRHHRHGVVDDPARIRELESTLGREVILLLLAEVRPLLPAALGLKKGQPPDPEQVAFAQMFKKEFETALERALDWSRPEAPEEREAFARDLEMYERTADADESPVESPDRGFSPFYDRCALLLDPSMMEAARSAAAQFEKQLVSAAAQIVADLGKATPGKPVPVKLMPLKPKPVKPISVKPKPARVSTTSAKATTARKLTSKAGKKNAGKSTRRLRRR